MVVPFTRLPGADQLAVYVDRVIRRQQQIGLRQVVSEGAPLNAHRGHGFQSRMRDQIDAPMADPLDRLRLQLPSRSVGRTMTNSPPVFCVGADPISL
jgi:hypothetical protein